MVRVLPDNSQDELELEPRRVLRAVAALPSLATLCNLLCGFLALLCCVLSIRAPFVAAPASSLPPLILNSLPSFITGGVYLVVLAMIFDALDGRLARFARRTSEFGAQLDSIADIVSFGAAPALLLVTLLMRHAPERPPDDLLAHAIWRVGLAGAVVYLSCAAIRLARYNVENSRDESSQRNFSGLPTPGAAGALTALVLLHEYLAYAHQAAGAAFVMRCGLGAGALAIGLLMVSRVSYVHVVNVYVRRDYPPTYLVWLLFFGAVAWYSIEMFLVALAFLYVAGGIAAHCWPRIAGRGAA